MASIDFFNDQLASNIIPTFQIKQHFMCYFPLCDLDVFFFSGYRRCASLNQTSIQGVMWKIMEG